MRTGTIRLASSLAVTALVVLAAAFPVRSAQPPALGSLLARMERVNAGLGSYVADLHVDVTTHGFPYLSPSLDGKAYFERPDKNAVVFDTVPALAEPFKRIYLQLPPPSEWPQLFAITPVSNDGTTAHFQLEQLKPGRIDHVDVTVDDRTATVSRMAYTYKDGGSIAFDQRYDVIDGMYVVRSQTGEIEIPHYSADVASRFSHYRLNVKIDPAVFAADSSAGARSAGAG